MFRKTLAAALTVAIVAGSAVSAPTTASAANGRIGFGIAAAVVGGIAGAVIAKASESRQDYGYRSYSNADCFEKQSTRWNAYGERVTAYTTVCR